MENQSRQANIPLILTPEELSQGQKWSIRIRWKHDWKILMACFYVYALLIIYQEKYSFQAFKFYSSPKIHIEKNIT